MKQFTIDEVGYKNARNRLLLIRIPLLLAATGTGFWITVGQYDDAINPLVIIPVSVLLVGAGLFWGLKREKKIIDSYAVTIDDNRITREQEGTPTISLAFMEIKKVQKTTRGSFIIKSERRTHTICIPYYINDHAELERMLLNLGPFSIEPVSAVYGKFRWAFSLVFLAMLILLYSSDNKVLVGICGIGLTAAGIWSFYQRLTNKNVPHDMRRRSWILLLFAVAILYTTWTKLAQ